MQGGKSRDRTDQHHLTPSQARRLQEAWERRLEKLLRDQEAGEHSRAMALECDVEDLLSQDLRRSAARVVLFPGMTSDQLLCLKSDLAARRVTPRWFDTNRNWTWMGQGLPDGARRKYCRPEPTEEFIEQFLREERRQRAFDVRAKAKTKRVPLFAAARRKRVQLRDDS